MLHHHRRVLEVQFQNIESGQTGFGGIRTHITEISIIYMLIAFLAIQLQGTLYNYYYVILRNSVKGDSTSRIFETTTPKALNGESQLAVNIFYKILRIRATQIRF